MIGGLIFSLMVFATGAVLDFAVTVSPYQHGFNIRTIGVILMIIGVVGALISVTAGLLRGEAAGGWRRHRTVVDDGQGHVMRRDDTYV
ncbi:MAG TPA: hypothetical protein VGG38_08005 [Acidimicrobiales bacterium]|jgi:hypothetical protein